MIGQDIIVKTTNAITSDSFGCGNKNYIGMLCYGLQGTEKVTIQCSKGDIDNLGNIIWQNLKVNGGEVYFDVNNNYITFSNFPYFLRVVKDATVAEVAVNVVEVEAYHGD